MSSAPSCGRKRDDGLEYTSARPGALKGLMTSMSLNRKYEGMSVGREERVLLLTGERWPGIRYGCTQRYPGGVSQGPWEGLNLGSHVGDEPNAVAENRRRLRMLLPGEPLWLEQVHGSDVLDADAYTGADPAPRADAAVTLLPHRVLAILTADCAPVVVADIDGRALGVAHAGWRGLAAGILERTVATLRQRLPHSRGWRAWVGPCIGPATFEVGADVLRAFVEPVCDMARFFRPAAAPGKWMADLPGLARHRLEISGVHTVELSGLCTVERPDLLYSYRRGHPTGRMATVAWISPPDEA